MRTAASRLKRRGLLAQCTKGALEYVVPEHRSTSCYVGVDPTAVSLLDKSSRRARANPTQKDSLHLGHLLTLKCLDVFREEGFDPIVLIGGATALIGDPTGRAIDREASDTDVVYANAESLTTQIQKITSYKTVNNADWWSRMSSIEFLRDVGVKFRLNELTSRDRYKNSMTFSEFSYQLMQAHDFYVLRKDHGCVTQIGGSDQFGNIVGGINYNTRRGFSNTMGVTTALVTDGNGDKIGKSSSTGKPVWLDGDKTSPFELYSSVVGMSNSSLRALWNAFRLQDDCAKFDAKEGRREVASLVVEYVHGVEALNAARLANDALFGDRPGAASASYLRSLVARGDVEGGTSLAECGITPSALRKLVKQKALAIDGVRIDDPSVCASVISTAISTNNICIVKLGKKRPIVIV